MLMPDGRSVVVKREIFIQSRLCIPRNLVPLYVDILIFNGSPNSLSKDVVEGSPLPSILMAIPFRRRTFVKSSLVNSEPWSLLNISGHPFSKVSSNASIQKEVSSELLNRQDNT